MNEQDQVVSFLEMVSKGQQILVRMLRGAKGDKEESKDFAFIPSDYSAESLYAKLQKKNAEGWNLFAQVGFIAGSKEPQGSNVLWADLDFKSYPGGETEVYELIEKLPVEPTMRVRSGHGVHLYWALAQSIHPEDARRLARGLQWMVGSDAVHNPNRIMRIPGLLNNKAGYDPTLACIEAYDPENTYSPTDLDESIDWHLAKLPHGVMKRLVLGPPSGTDRSAYDFGLAVALMENGLKDKEVRYLLSTYKGSGKIGEMGTADKYRYIDRTIAQARKKVGHISEPDDNPIANPQFTLFTIEQMETQFQPSFVIQDLLPESGILIIGAEPKARKSFFAMQLGLCMATGTKFLGYETYRQRKVLYVQAELAPFMVGQRFGTLLGKKPRPMNLLIANIRAADLTENPEWLIELVEREKFEVVIIDPVAKFISGDENNSISVGQFFSNLGRLQSKGVSVVLVHHSRKTSKGEKVSANTMRGSNRWFADVDAALIINKTEDPSEMLLHYDLRAAQPRTEHGIYVQPDGSFGMSPYLTPEERALMIELKKQESERQRNLNSDPVQELNATDSRTDRNSQEAGVLRTTDGGVVEKRSGSGGVLRRQANKPHMDSDGGGLAAD